MVIFLRFLYVYLRVLCKRRDITKGNKPMENMSPNWDVVDLHPDSPRGIRAIHDAPGLPDRANAC